MSLIDQLLGQVTSNVDVQGLAAKVGLSPEQVEQAVAALGAAHPAPGDTVTTAAAQTGLPTTQLQQIVEHIGGEGALRRLRASLSLTDSSADSNVLGTLENALVYPVSIRNAGRVGQRRTTPSAKVSI